MHSIANYKIAVRLVVLILLSLTLWGFSRRRVETQQNEQFIPIAITNQPEPVNGTVPVEIRCGKAHLTSPSRLEPFSCTLKNNSTQSVTAANAVYSVILETSEGTVKETYNSTVDALVHPDFKQSNKLIGTGDETTVGPPGPSFYPNAIVKGIEIGIDYVEFEDGTALGPDRGGSQLIRTTREGAVKYREWLREQYKRNGKIVEGIVPLLQSSQPLPQDLKLTGSEETGANAYRHYLLKLDRALGRSEVEKRLN